MVISLENCMHRKLFFLLFSLVPIILCWTIFPSNAHTLYPWWLPVVILSIFTYLYMVRYFGRSSGDKLHSITRILLCILDISLCIPATFLIFVILVKINIIQIPTIFERKAMSSQQMLVVQNNLFSIYSREYKPITTNKTNIEREWEGLKTGLLFQIRMWKRAHSKNYEVSQIIQNMEKIIQGWQYPANDDKKTKILQNLAEFVIITEDKIAPADKLWQGKRKILQQAYEKLQNIPLSSKNASLAVPVYIPFPEIYYHSEEKCIIVWKDQDKSYQYTLNLTMIEQLHPLLYYHSIILKPISKNYIFQLQRYPKVENIFLEEGIKNSIEISITPEENTLNFTTKYISFFHRLSLLGTVAGNRNQDIFLRIVLAFEQTYVCLSLGLVVIFLLLLGSWPVCELHPSVPKSWLKKIQYLFQIIQNSTSIPVYASISVIFIGMYDGKNFTVLFICVAYFLLPSLYNEITRQVKQYQQTFMPAKLGLGFSHKTIIWHFVYRECRMLYLSYMLYFCAITILLETSFAYIKGGAPSELSLGIFLHLGQNRPNTETYSCIIVLVFVIYFFCRQATLLRGKNR